MNATLASSSTFPYSTQSSKIAPSAPKSIAILRIKISPTPVSTSPVTITNAMSIEKYSLARSFFPWPSVMDTSALPPVPIIKPTDPNIMSTGIMRLTAANESLPTQFDTKIPSTTP